MVQNCYYLQNISMLRDANIYMVVKVIHQPLSLPAVCIINYLLVFCVASPLACIYSWQLGLLALFGPTSFFVVS
jgi:hypothetical protein